MNMQLMFLTAGLLVVLAGVFLVVWMGYKWGKFAAFKAIAENSPKWKAYMLAVLPPAAFAVALLFDGTLEQFACKIFCGLAVPAMLGTCVRINYSSYSTF